MNIVGINTLCGLYNMLYNKNDNLNNVIKEISSCNNVNVFFNINNLFWSHVLDNKTIRHTIENFTNISHTFEQLTIQEQYVIHAPEVFINNVMAAKEKITLLDLNEEDLFSYIETLNIFCHLYNKLLPTNFTLSIEAGFHRSSNSAREMLANCLLEYSNPYLNFIIKSVLPVIINYKPDIIWMQGIPNIASFAIAKLVKMQLPNIHISITNHSTEYYSLNKIRDNLLQNQWFFDCFDSVILNANINETKQKIVQYLKEEKNLANINNLILKKEQSIAHITESHITYPQYDFEEKYFDANSVINIRLFPKNHCYWNRCTFCGINNKYLEHSNEWDLNDAWIQLEYLSRNKIKYFWSIDEAIPPHILFELARKINLHNYNFIWHTRSRLDIDWINDDIVKELALSGLTQIRLGFESASLRILKLMNKHSDCQIALDNVEKILKVFFKYNIRVHFPAIIGFPTETLYERNKTIKFLQNLKDKYPLFSYNINILELDISSKLYKNWDKYNITNINLPCSANSFLGNMADWNEPIVHASSYSLEKSRESAMLYQYPWYPLSAITKPHTFYRLYESGRYMLYNHAKQDVNLINNIKRNFIIEKTPHLVSWRTLLGTYVTYNPKNHHYYECSSDFFKLLNENDYLLIDDEKYIEIVNKLIQQKFIRICERR